jgi:hypothetical protein
LHVLGTPPAFVLSQDQTLHRVEQLGERDRHPGFDPRRSNVRNFLRWVTHARPRSCTGRTQCLPYSGPALPILSTRIFKQRFEVPACDCHEGDLRIRYQTSFGEVPRYCEVHPATSELLKGLFPTLPASRRSRVFSGSCETDILTGSTICVNSGCYGRRTVAPTAETPSPKGERGDLNPRPPEPQSGALTN